MGNSGVEKEEKELIRQCIEKNPVYQKLLFERFAGKMMSICYRYTGNEDDAKDILQEGFIKLFGNLEQYGFKGSFEGWVKRIFIHASIEWYRKGQRQPDFFDIEETNISDSTLNALQNLQAKDLMGLIAKLPSGYRAVFNLFVIEGYSHQEIAEMLQISENTSKTQLMKARLYLQKLLTQN